jgi:hypothetical protein
MKVAVLFLLGILFLGKYHQHLLFQCPIQILVQVFNFVLAKRPLKLKNGQIPTFKAASSNLVRIIQTNSRMYSNLLEGPTPTEISEDKVCCFSAGNKNLLLES